MPKDILAIQAEQRILILRDQKVMLDFHLAELYGVETRALKQALSRRSIAEPEVRRNPKRFPADFMFELTNEESQNLVSQTVIPGLGNPTAHWPHGTFPSPLPPISNPKSPISFPVLPMVFPLTSRAAQRVRQM